MFKNFEINKIMNNLSYMIALKFNQTPLRDNYFLKLLVVERIIGQII